MKLKEWAPLDPHAWLDVTSQLEPLDVTSLSMWTDPCGNMPPVVNPNGGVWNNDVKTIFRDREQGRYIGSGTGGEDIPPDDEADAPLQERLRNLITQEISNLFHQGALEEGSCGYTQSAPDGNMLTTPGGTKGMDGYSRTQQMTKGTLQERFQKLANIK